MTPKKPTQTWKFESRHASDIDFVKIASELSYTNPLALVKPEGTTGKGVVWLVTHYKLLLKARLLDEMWPQRLLPPEKRAVVRLLLDLTTRGYPVRGNTLDYVTRIELGELAEFVAAAKEVKALPWPDNEDKKTRTIEVTTLSV